MFQKIGELSRLAFSNILRYTISVKIGLLSRFLEIKENPWRKNMVMTVFLS